MANVARLVVKNTTYSTLTPSAGAASFTAQLGSTTAGAYSDHRAVLVVDNRNTDVITRVAVSAGDGIRSCLGDLEIDIAVSTAAAIPLTDSMRFITQTTQSVSVALTDTSDTALTAGPLANITCMLIQG